jgi:hypothetical protein
MARSLASGTLGADDGGMNEQESPTEQDRSTDAPDSTTELPGEEQVIDVDDRYLEAQGEDGGEGPSGGQGMKQPGIPDEPRGPAEGGD